MKHLERESRKRERSMARAAERAGGGEGASDGNAKALKEVERLEAEVEVYRMKNSSLTKQIEDEEHRYSQALQSFEAQQAKLQAVVEKLQSEDTQKRLKEEQQQQDSQLRAEEELRAEIRALPERKDLHLYKKDDVRVSSINFLTYFNFEWSL